MKPSLDVLLLLALPASGKSEIRRYLDHLDPEQRRADLGIATPLQLDDFPYVHMMRRISQEMRRIGEEPAFFADDTSIFGEPRDWLTLVHLLNEDYRRIGVEASRSVEPGRRLLERFEKARRLAGCPPPFAGLDDAARRRLEAAIDEEAAPLVATIPQPDGEFTVIIEMARGGPGGAEPPLPSPLGYRHSLAVLAPEILSRSVALYIWVTPEESRRRNRQRARPGREGDASILYHGVPEPVMQAEYGTDDMAWLLEESGRPDTIRIRADGQACYLPTTRFDNRDDFTSFLREEPSDWPASRLEDLHRRLVAAVDRLADGS